jgi:hypothetical protein
VRTAKKAALSALAATVMALVTPMTPASADQGDTFTRGCGFDTNQQDTVTNGENQGVIYVAGISQEASGLPSTATVSCWIDVNGVEQPGTRLTTTGTGVIVNSQQITFNSVDGDSINECQSVTFADGSTWTAADGNVGVDCPAAIEVVIPPQVVTDLLDTLFITVIDPTICPILVTLGQLTGGGVAGVVTIGPDGDLSIIDPLDLGINPIEDCPPYITT